MKTAVAIALIIAGVVLIMMPTVSDYLYQKNTVKLLEVKGTERVDLAGQMGERYRFGCWIAGVATIFCAIGFSVVDRKKGSNENHTESPPEGQ